MKLSLTTQNLHVQLLDSSNHPIIEYTIERYTLHVDILKLAEQLPAFAQTLYDLAEKDPARIPDHDGTMQ